jgi:hypothetical protein
MNFDPYLKGKKLSTHKKRINKVFVKLNDAYNAIITISYFRIFIEFRLPKAHFYGFLGMQP